MQLIPTTLDQASPQALNVVWNNGEHFHVPFFELRMECPCAVCVDEKTGKRVITRDQVQAEVKPTGIELVGRYAIKINWNDAHSTGMFHYDRLYELCNKHGKRFDS